MRSSRRAQTIWLIAALATVYAAALQAYSLAVPGWKPHRVETAWIVFAVVLTAGLIGNVNGARVPSASAPSRSRWLLPLALAGTVYAYLDVIAIGYLSDDYVLLAMQGGSWQHGAAEFVRILPVALIHAAERALPGAGDVYLHCLAVGLHCLNGLLVSHIARRLDLGEAGSVAAAALFLTFPAAVEAVAWISGLQDVLMTTLSLGFVLAALDRCHVAVLLSLLAAGLLSKETAVAMPVLAAAALWARGLKPPPHVVRAVAIAFALAAAFAIWRLALAGGEAGPPVSRYALKEILSGAFGTLALPWTTAELRAVNVAGFVMVAWIVAGAWIVLRAPGREPARVALLGLLWVAAGVAPVNRLFFVSDWLEGSRYLYLPSAGWALAMAAAVSAASPPVRNAFGALTGAVVLAWTIGTAAHVSDWRAAGHIRAHALMSVESNLLRHTECTATAFVRPPDTVRGAYVFRNGFREALAREGLRASTDAAGADCVFTWTGDAFERVR